MARLRQELASLESELAEREIELLDLTAAVDAFERLCRHVLASRYAELDALKARIAEAAAASRPGNSEARHRAKRAREQADRSYQTAEYEEAQPPPEGAKQPTEEVRALYRKVVKRIHPDLARSEEDREARHALMVEANRAYEDGDVQYLGDLLRRVDKWGAADSSGTAATLAASLTLRIANAGTRLEALEEAIAAIRASDRYLLAIRAEESGRVIDDLAARLDAEIAQLTVRLTAMGVQ